MGCLLSRCHYVDPKDDRIKRLELENTALHDFIMKYWLDEDQ
jgi:hypothetical protein